MMCVLDLSLGLRNQNTDVIRPAYSAEDILKERKRVHSAGKYVLRWDVCATLMYLRHVDVCVQRGIGV